MALKIYDTLVPQGDYPAVKAEDVQMPDGTKLSELEIPEIPDPITDYVKTVNGIAPDENGDVQVEIPEMPEIPNDYVKTVNGKAPDENGNVTVEIPEASGGVSSWNDLTDKPFHEEEAMTAVMAEQDITGFANVGYGVPSKGFNFGEGMDAFALELGAEYTVMWDGEAYPTTAQDISAAMGDGTYALGNAAAINSAFSGNNEPFIIGWSAIGITILVADGSMNTTHKVGIFRSGGKVWKLNAECLPMKAIDDRIDAYISAALEGDY